MKNRDNMLLLNKIATERAKMGFDVTNGTIGMFYLDDGTFPKFKLIREILSKHVNDEDFAYSSIPGEEKYRSLLLEWFFHDLFNDQLKDTTARTIATVGGTGAISIASTVEDKMNKDNVLFFPNPGWPNYYGVCVTQKIPYVQYDMFINGKFGLDTLLENIDKCVKEDKHVTLVINDPCHNPTGYSMKEDEWNKIFNFVKEKQGKVSVILDCAYIDFSEENNRDLLVNFVKNAMKYTHVYISLSCSKTFSFYGLRLGELISFYSNKDELEIIQQEVVKAARCFWSNANHMGMNAISEMLSNEQAREELTTEIKEAKQIVNKRKEIFLKEADEVGLVYFPYEQGFFITLPVDNAYDLSDRLIEKEIFLSPTSETTLRVAICCIPTKKIYGLAKKIKDEMKK